MGAMAFVLTNGLALLASAAASRAAFRDEPPAVRVLLSLALFPVIVLLTMLALGLAQILSTPGALLLLSAVAVAVSPAFLRRPGPTPPLKRISEAPWHELTDTPFGRLALVLAIAAAVPVLGRTLLAGPHFSIDDLKYHAPYVTWWMQHGGFNDTVSYYYYAYYPFNAELFALWFVLPFRQDGQATLAGAFWLILLAVSLIVLLRSLGRSPAQSLLLVALVFSLRIVSVSALRYSAVDLAGVSATLAAIALIASSTPRMRLWYLAGAVCGFAVGSKAIFFPAAGLILLWILLQPSAGGGVAARMKRSALYVVGLLTTGSFWYFRNIWLTGNPVFPAHLGPLAGPMQTEHVGRSSLGGWFVEHGLDASVLKPLLLSVIDWPWPHLVLATVGVLCCAAAVAKGRISGHERSVWVLILLVIGGSLLSYVFMPASGFDTHPGQPIEIKDRFLILPSGLSLLCFALWITRVPRLRYINAGATAVCVAAAWSQPWPVAGVVTLVAGGMLLFGGRVLALIARLRLHRWIPVFVVLALVLLALWQPVAQELTDRRLLERYDVQGSVWDDLSELPAGTRVASVGPASRYAYPLFGRHLTLHPVVFSLRGGIRRPLHELWREAPETIEWSDDGTPAAVGEFLRNCRSAGIHHIYLSRSPTGAWPFQVDSLDPATGGTLLFGNERVQLWEIAR